MTTIHLLQEDESILDIDISDDPREYARIGDRVVIIDSLLYTGRTGVLKSSSDDWDFHVDLDAKENPQKKIDEEREIGVYNFQVIKLATQRGDVNDE